MVLFVRYFFHVPFSFTPLKLRYTVILFLCWFFFLSHLSRSTFFSTFSFWFQSGHKWRSHRKLIAPTFHLNVLKGFIDLFNENSRQVIKKLDLELGKTFDAHDHMSEATVEILLGKKITLHILLLLCFFHSIVHSFIQHTIFFVHLLNLPLTWNEVGSTNHFLPITWNAFCLLRWCIMVFRFNVFQAKSFPLCCRYFISHPAFPSHTHTPHQRLTSMEEITKREERKKWKRKKNNRRRRLRRKKTKSCTLKSFIVCYISIEWFILLYGLLLMNLARNVYEIHFDSPKRIKWLGNVHTDTFRSHTKVV